MEKYKHEIIRDLTPNDAVTVSLMVTALQLYDRNTLYNDLIEVITPRYRKVKSQNLNKLLDIASAINSGLS